jgi:hypothetical protein
VYERIAAGLETEAASASRDFWFLAGRETRGLLLLCAPEALKQNTAHMPVPRERMNVAAARARSPAGRHERGGLRGRRPRVARTPSFPRAKRDADLQGRMRSSSNA